MCTAKKSEKVRRARGACSGGPAAPPQVSAALVRKLSALSKGTAIIIDTRHLYLSDAREREPILVISRCVGSHRAAIVAQMGEHSALWGNTVVVDVVLAGVVHPVGMPSAAGADKALAARPARPGLQGLHDVTN